jgi:bacteriophage N4 adsorption protein B
MDWTGLDTLSALLFGVAAILPPLAIMMALSGLDDLFVDAAFACFWLRRRQANRLFGGATVRDLPADNSCMAIAVFIPAWDESAIIGAMLRSSLASWQDDVQLRLFVGWYANDLATGRAIAELATQDARIVSVAVPRPGPTTKADCLNHLWVMMQQHERSSGLRFDAIVLHDAEDRVSPAEPAAVRHLIGTCGKNLVQFPVLPVPVRGAPMVSGHYLDEFAESHARDMQVREWMGASLPAAGVGCAFARPALEDHAQRRGGLPFNSASLTEDYDLGLALSRDRGGAFVRIAAVPAGALVATREHFPDQFFAAVRQKARWLMGITLQGWEHMGWQGGLADRYWLMRDRKAILSFYLNLSCFSVAALLIAIEAWQQAVPQAPQFAPLVSAPWLNLLLLFNGFLLLWRLLVRALFVWRAAGRWQALLSLPRSLVGNAINIAAAMRALRLYLTGKARGTATGWDKTGHHALPEQPVLS